MSRLGLALGDPQSLSRKFAAPVATTTRNCTLHYTTAQRRVGKNLYRPSFVFLVLAPEREYTQTQNK